MLGQASNKIRQTLYKDRRADNYKDSNITRLTAKVACHHFEGDDIFSSDILISIKEISKILDKNPQKRQL